MKKIKFGIVLLFVLLLAGNAFSENIGGIIYSDETWSITNSPYMLTSDVQIAFGSTLTIEPGVIVYGNNYSIAVFGTLNAVGTDSDNIEFIDVNIKPGKNEYSEAYLINIQFSKINSGSIYAAGNSGYGSLTLKYSMIENVPFLYLWYPTDNCYIEKNVFTNSGGISVGISNEIIVYIKNNVFYQWTGDFAIKNWAAYNSSETIVENNSFLDSDKTALLLPSGYSSAAMSAQNNFWNTTDLSIIESMIYDKNDDLSCAGYIEFEPILTEPHPDTPSLNTNQKPTADAGIDQIVFDEITLSGIGSYDSDGSIVSYSWSLQHRTNSANDRLTNGENPTVSYLSPGVYDVLLTVTDNDGLTDTDQMEFVAIGLKGDLNLDGVVDGEDLAIFSENFGR